MSSFEQALNSWDPAEKSAFAVSAAAKGDSIGICKEFQAESWILYRPHKTVAACLITHLLITFINLLHLLITVMCCRPEHRDRAKCVEKCILCSFALHFTHKPLNGGENWILRRIGEAAGGCSGLAQPPCSTFLCVHVLYWTSVTPIQKVLTFTWFRKIFRGDFSSPPSSGKWIINHLQLLYFYYNPAIFQQKLLADSFLIHFQMKMC